MLKAFIIIILLGLIVLAAGCVYNWLMTAETFQTVHKMHAAPDKTARDPGGFLMWLGGGIAMIGGAGVVHVFLSAVEEEEQDDSSQG